ADNKLCFAAISDPHVNHLLPRNLLEMISDWVPWSRAVAGLTGKEMEMVSTDKDGYVLKSAYGTRSQGVVIGSAVDSSSWATALGIGRQKNCLVQRFVPTARLDGGEASHDISIGVSGEVVGALARSNANPILNVAEGALLHPVYLRAGL